jgi:hypothetical protein
MLSILYGRAITILLTQGWCQDVERDSDGRVCLIQALRDAQGDLSKGWLRAAILLASQRLPVTGACDPASLLASWNDLPSTSFEDVVLVLKDVQRQAQLRGC